MKRKGLEKTLWLVVGAVVAILVLYLVLVIVGKGFGLFESNVQTGAEQAKTHLQDAIENVMDLFENF